MGHPQRRSSYSAGLQMLASIDMHRKNPRWVLAALRLLLLANQ
jgi:hypothetical protein